MGFFEFYCQLCGISFEVARIRRPDEQPGAGWSGYGRGDVITSLDPCSELSGCRLSCDEDGDSTSEREHLAGPGCCTSLGYSGHRISVDEMKGCHDVQCLVFKPDSWEREHDDQEFEIESDYFLTGIGKDPNCNAPLQRIKPARHGINQLWISNTLLEGMSAPVAERGLPFHPTCFEVFKKVSQLRLGKIDISGLCHWRSHILAFDPDEIYSFPRTIHARLLRKQEWCHEPGSEYLVANPVSIPSLPQLLKAFLDKSRLLFQYNPQLAWNLPIREQHFSIPAQKQQTSQIPPTDPFSELPSTVKYAIMSFCSPTDLANLRLTTRACQELPLRAFRHFLLRDMPWFWEALDLPIDGTYWPELYQLVKYSWSNLKGLQNRKRIWGDIEDLLLGRLARYRREGRIPDTDRGPVPGTDGHGGAVYTYQTARRSLGAGLAPRRIIHWDTCAESGIPTPMY